MSKTNYKILLHPFYLVNAFLASSFILTKFIPPVCRALYESCELEMREYELLVMLACFVTLKNKRHSNVQDYLSHFCIYNAAYAMSFAFFWLLQAWLVPKPVYSGPEKICYFRDSTFESEVLSGNSKTYWLITFYTAWSPACVKFASIFSELSNQYSLNNLRFGKLDVTRYSEIANKLKIDISSWSNQLPTVILFCNGQEIERRPAINSKCKVIQKFYFNWESVVRAFDLNNLSEKLKATASSNSSLSEKKKQ
ncbi:Thioredoxin- transmembrane protein 2 [Cichlidogyrus casuarinus]|uniref:Thioredoxin- transmembrane protein 2 n=1 Tax=Cichlidogyrus casuarinus TaxID=1844966 RepID=A0ABD2PYS4_9PLAT